MIYLGLNIFFWKFADQNFVVCFSVVKELKFHILGGSSCILFYFDSLFGGGCGSRGVGGLGVGSTL